MIDIELLWENYAELGERVTEGELSREDFEKQVYAFSTFLSGMNKDYHYNGTYLPHYIDEFLDFLECFYRKYPLVKVFFEVASCYTEVSLIIDRYWQQDCIFDNEKEKIFTYWKVCPSYEKGLVYSEEMLVECSVLCETKRFIYQSKIGNVEEKVLQEVEKLREFLNNKATLRDGEV
ncbi:hypothetical protein [Faecalicatena faecalis]|nr:hypothetical protein [Faecalicatena faecalis]